MDFYSKGFFIHEFGDMKSANFIFHVPSPRARGNQEILMISIISLEEGLRMELFQEVLENFSQLFAATSDVYQGLYYSSKDIPMYPAKAEEVKHILSRFYESLPLQRALFNLRVSKLLLFGISKEQIDPIIKRLKETFLKYDNISDDMSIAKNIIGNISILSYNFKEKNYYKEILSVYLKDLDGLIFAVDISNSTAIESAIEELKHLKNFPHLNTVPMLILLLNRESMKASLEEILTKLSLSDLLIKDYKYYEISSQDNLNFESGFRWISMQIMQRILRSPERLLS